MPVAVFAIGPLTAEEHDLEGSRGQLEQALAAGPEVKPIAIAVFGGVVDPAKLRFPLSRMPRSDARDWDAIHAWADELATSFGAPAVVAV